MSRLPLMVCLVLLLAPYPVGVCQDALSANLPGTQSLEMSGDIASQLVSGVDRFLLGELQQSLQRRSRHWTRDLSSTEAYEQSIEANRLRLAHIIGARDARTASPQMRLQASPTQSALVARSENYEVLAVTWKSFADVNGHGLLLSPTDTHPIANIVAIPDCGQIPEQIVGLAPGVPSESHYARRLAENGCRVLVPLLINREDKLSHLSNREWLYRSAFEMGRGLIGYEVQKVLAGVDWFVASGADVPIGVMGWGEGGLITLYAAALDRRIDAACVSGYFDSRQNIWREPLDRNVFGLLDQFGDAELASLIAPRALVVEACQGPEATLPGGRGAPARVATPNLHDVRGETDRARSLVAALNPRPRLELIVSGKGQGPCGTGPALLAFLRNLSDGQQLRPTGDAPTDLRGQFDPQPRHEQQMHELDRHTQRLLSESHVVRQQNTMSRFDFMSLQTYERSAHSVRKDFYDEVIGRFSSELLPANPRSRQFQESDKWIGYEVVLDVFPDVIAYGLLLVPKNIASGERRPVVVCQHGLEGRPQHTIGAEGSQYYDAFAANLADRGFVTFAPQNLYIFGDRFRTLQRKANALGKTLFSIITPQHQQIVKWLADLPFVDGRRIGFYGLSYGGKTAMRVPAIVTDYCLSICSADFNEWVDKNASTSNPRSYVNSAEYEIFEFDLGNTFNYAEMAALIAPRPFMVERGHFDGVADDWTVAHEYAKVRHLFAARLKIPDKTQIEWFDGPHKINGVGSFDFLHRHLDFPAPK